MIEKFFKNALLENKPFKACILPLIALPILWILDVIFVIGIGVVVKLTGNEIDPNMVLNSLFGIGFVLTIGFIAYLLEVASELIRTLK